MTCDQHPPATADAPRVWCVIPVYNNAGTLRAVAEGCRTRIDSVLVVDDGSTDAEASALLDGLDVTVVRHDTNRGKGAALVTAARFVSERDGTHMITIDADGQHDPDDLPAFLTAIGEDTDAVIVGSRDFSHPSVPGSSRFGRAFSNFWLRLETGVSLPDTQSGFRAYPVGHLEQLGLRGRHYDFEAEVLTRAAWAGLPLRAVPVRVWYPERREDRVSSFRPFLDNHRIALTHTRLVLRRLLPWPHRKRVSRPDRWRLLLHPRAFISALMKEHATPSGLAAAAAVGVFLGVLPLISCHMLVVLFVASRLNLNKVMALGIQNLCMPPFVPLACIELGYYMRHGAWLTRATKQTIVYEAPERLLEWLLGSLLLAPLLAILAATIVYMLARFSRKLTRNAARYTL
jgi:glycosyltransferase involved in cell wall biosynthesis